MQGARTGEEKALMQEKQTDLSRAEQMSLEDLGEYYSWGPERHPFDFADVDGPRVLLNIPVDMAQGSYGRLS